MDTKNNVSKLLFALFFIFLTAVIALTSILPAFTVNTGKMTGTEKLSYTNGYLTRDREYDDEISIGLMSFISVITDINDLKQLVFAIRFQEEYASEEENFAYAIKEAVESGDLDAVQRANDKLLEKEKEYLEYEDREKLDELLRDEEFLDKIQLYYAIRYLLLSYLTESGEVAQIMLDERDGGNTRSGSGYVISMLAVTFLAGFTLIVSIGGLLVRLILLLLVSLKNLIFLGSYIKKCPERMPEKVLPGKCLIIASVILFILKILFGEVIKIEPASYILLIAPMVLPVLNGLYKITAGDARKEKYRIIWILRILNSALVMLAFITLMSTSVTTFGEFCTNGDFTSVIEAAEAYTSKLVIELVLRLLSLLLIIGFAYGLAGAAAGFRIEVEEGKFETVFANGSSVFGAVIILTIMILLYFLVPDQSIVIPVIMLEAILVSIFTSKVPAILGKPEPRPMKRS